MTKENNMLMGLLKQKTKPVDNIPAHLTENEFVIPADVVLIAGHGDVAKGENYFKSIMKKMRKTGKKKVKRVLKKHLPSMV